MTPEELHNATVPWRTAHQAEVALRPERDRLILQALHEGMTQRAAAEAVGVSHALPGHIVRTATETVAEALELERPANYPAVGDTVHNAHSFQYETWIVTGLTRRAEWDATKGRGIQHPSWTVTLRNEVTGLERTLDPCSAKTFWRNWKR